MLKVLVVVGLLLPGNPTPFINKIEVESVETCTAKISEWLDKVSKVNETYQAMGQCLVSHDKDKEANTD